MHKIKTGVLSVASEIIENIFNYILIRVKQEENKSNRKKLIESIDLRGLNSQYIKELIENIQFEDLTEQLFSLMKDKMFTINLDENKENDEGK